MHPQTFLKTFWQLEMRPEVFVAMSFAPQYKSRFELVIEPAIRSIAVEGVALAARRVDISKSGDSILTEISDGIAHSRLVLADVSTIGKDSVTGRPFRNANVLYEVGQALAARNSAEVLLIRDDHDDFLFDVSTTPHMTIDFTDQAAASKIIADELRSRLREQQFQSDARVQIALASLSTEEVALLRLLKENVANSVWGWELKDLSNWNNVACQRLLDKRIFKMIGEFTDQRAAFMLTPLGAVVLSIVSGKLKRIETLETKQFSIKDGRVEPHEPAKTNLPKT